jgi:hypothetical protein
MTLLGGCVTHLRSGSSPGGATATSIVHDNAVTLDFRNRPTRADVGLPADRNSRSYGTTGTPLQVTLILPAGPVVVPAFDVTAATDSSGGALDKNYSHTPKDFLVSSRFANGADVRASLDKNAAVLGLSQADLDLALPSVGTGAVVPQQRVLHGLVKDWLSVDVELMDGENGQVVVEYSIGIDVYHNAAVDQVVRGGIFTADLTRRPTRAALGLLDGYSSAFIQPAWQQSLSLHVTLPDGVLTGAVSSISTSSGAEDTDGRNQPISTSIQLAPSTAAALQQRLGVDGPLLGLDPTQLAAIFSAPTGGDRVQQTLTGTSTSVYAVSAKFDVTPGGANAFSAVVTYNFTYK